MCVDGLWRTVCGRGWDFRESDILCHQLNFNGSSFPVYPGSSSRGYYDLIDIRCMGSESNLSQCELGYQSCSNWGPAGTYCSYTECDHGESVLVGGFTDNNIGRVEYCYEGQWYTLCADDWEDSGKEIQLICKDHNYDPIHYGAVIDYYGRGKTSILPYSIRCQETHMSFKECSTTALDVSQCSRVAGVVCDAPCTSDGVTQCQKCDYTCYSNRYNCACSSQCFNSGNCCPDVATTQNCMDKECENGAIRLYGGDTRLFGAVEVCVSGKWGSVCPHDGPWTIDNAKVACRQLKFSDKGAEVLTSSSITMTRGYHVLGAVNCVGTESELLECQHYPIGHHSCDEITDAPVIISCKEKLTDCEHGEVTMVGSYVEFCEDGRWINLCSKGFNDSTAKVICRQLNYETGDLVEKVSNCSKNEGINDLMLLGEVHCSGTEQYFNECRYSAIMSNHCLCHKISCYTSGKGGTLGQSLAAVTTTTIATAMTPIVTGIIIFYCLWKHKKRKVQRQLKDIMAVPGLDAPTFHEYLSTRHSAICSNENQPPELIPQCSVHPLTQDYGESLVNCSYQMEELHRRKLLIKHTAVLIKESIGEGIFGIVFKGVMKSSGNLVALKTMKGTFDQVDLDYLVEEALKMSEFHHRHVMNIIAISVDTGSAPYIIMPYMENGSLLEYLQREKTRVVLPDEANTEKVHEVRKKLLEMSRQIASGMEYLTSKKYIHRDLAARNCMIDAHFVIKVSDFGLSEDVFEKSYLRLDITGVTGICRKWMGLECLAEGLFSEKTDVWSYGVTMWEIFSGGETPSYPDSTNLALLQSLMEGNRLSKPNNAACNNASYRLMRQCWEEDPDDRPSFQKLHSVLSSVLEGMLGYLQLNNPFTEDEKAVEEASKV